jgi:hypothetical protein
MSPPEPIDVPRQRRRLAVMLIINGVCAAIAIGALYGFIDRHIPWMGAVFAAALVAGFSAHVWLVMGLKRKG